MKTAIFILCMFALILAICLPLVSIFENMDDKQLSKQEKPKLDNKKGGQEEKENIFCVYLEDRYFDMKMDNDDMDDFPTVIKVTYNSKGNIVNKEFPKETRTKYVDEFITNTDYKFNGDLEYHGLSDFAELNHFYSTCHINPFGGMRECKKYTIYNRGNEEERFI